MNKSIICILTIFLLVGAIFMSGCIEQEQEKALTSVTVSMNPTFLGEAGFNIALEKGYFEEEGLNITTVHQAAGWKSLKDMLEGKADISHCADLPIVYTAFDKKKFTDFEREDFYIFGDMIYTSTIQQVIGRRDSNISQPSDIIGKRVGLLQGTTSDYLLDGFLIEQGINSSDIEIVNMGVLELVDALVADELDVIFSWQPHANNARDQLGNNSIFLDMNLTYTTSWFILVGKEFAENNSDVLESYLRAIHKADQFIKNNPNEAMTIHSAISGSELDVLSELWPTIDYTLSLSESSLNILEDEARWIIRTGLTNQTEVPNFMDYIYLDAMEKVYPEGVTIIR